MKKSFALSACYHRKVLDIPLAGFTSPTGAHCSFWGAYFSIFFLLPHFFANYKLPLLSSLFPLSWILFRECIWFFTYSHLFDTVLVVPGKMQGLPLVPRTNFEFHWFPQQNSYRPEEWSGQSIWEKAVHLVRYFCFPRSFSEEIDSYSPNLCTFPSTPLLFITIWLPILTSSSFDPWWSCSILCPETPPRYPRLTNHIWSWARSGILVWNPT